MEKECMARLSRRLWGGTSQKTAAKEATTLFDCLSYSKKDFANQQALAKDIKVRKDMKK